MVNNRVPRAQTCRNTKGLTDKVERKFIICNDTDRALDNLSLIFGIPRGQIIDIMTDSMTLVYTTFVQITGQKPELNTLNDVFSSLLIHKPL